MSKRGTTLARTPDVTKAIEAVVARALRSELAGVIRQLEKRINRLNDQVSRLGRVAGKGIAAPRPDRPPSKGRQLQGRYIGLLRNLTKKNQARVKSIRKKKGVEAAIREARRLRKN